MYWYSTYVDYLEILVRRFSFLWVCCPLSRLNWISSGDGESWNKLVWPPLLPPKRPLNNFFNSRTAFLYNQRWRGLDFFHFLQSGLANSCIYHDWVIPTGNLTPKRKRTFIDAFFAEMVVENLNAAIWLNRSLFTPKTGPLPRHTRLPTCSGRPTWTARQRPERTSCSGCPTTPAERRFRRLWADPSLSSSTKQISSDKEFRMLGKKSWLCVYFCLSCLSNGFYSILPNRESLLNPFVFHFE